MSTDTALTLRPADVGKALGIHRVAAGAMMADGRIRAANIGTQKRAHWRTCRAWLDEFRRGQAVGLNQPTTADNADSSGRDAGIPAGFTVAFTVVG